MADGGWSKKTHPALRHFLREKEARWLEVEG
jgi:hypothetical protein